MISAIRLSPMQYPSGLPFANTDSQTDYNASSTLTSALDGSGFVFTLNSSISSITGGAQGGYGEAEEVLFFTANVSGSYALTGNFSFSGASSTAELKYSAQLSDDTVDKDVYVSHEDLNPVMNGYTGGFDPAGGASTGALQADTTILSICTRS